MPVLTPLEGKAVFDLSQPGVHVIGRTRIDEMLVIIQKLHDGMQEAKEQLDAQKFLLNAFWMTSIGKLNEQQIMENARLSEEQRNDLLNLVYLYEDALLYRTKVGDYQPIATAFSSDEPIISPV